MSCTVRGEFTEAEAAYREASRHGCEPQPGLARLRLMQGDADTAAAVIRRVLKDPGDRATRARLLKASVELMLAVGAGEAAAGAATELAEIAAHVDAPVLHAMSLDAAAALCMHRGDFRAALGHAHSAGPPGPASRYEHAASRQWFALACRDLGDRDTAQLEADAARQTFEQMGAAPDVDRVKELFPGPLPAST